MSDLITYDELHEMMAYCHATTRGPWLLSDKQEKRVRIRSGHDTIIGGFGRLICYGPEIQYCTTPEREALYRADGKFIVDAHTDLPRLITAYRKLQLEVIALRKINRAQSAFKKK
ncbi:hypothetical protein LCGC14_2865140 [marine sediment metagenome]|uniref:Uncharacterized protein n=1 Tax=marine sediment metagenome TaxID=412755 RepID=A0A0F8YR79_9ZZZZ